MLNLCKETFWGVPPKEANPLSVQDVITLLGALATFLFGMSTMTSGLEKLASGKLASLLEKLTDNILKGVLLGAVVAGMVHSSAATTVMCIGFVNAGILKLRQAVGVIMGANIGTTITAQILRLGGLSDENLLLSLLRPEMLGSLLAFAGILFFSFFNSGRKKPWARCFWAWVCCSSASSPWRPPSPH